MFPRQKLKDKRDLAVQSYVSEIETEIESNVLSISLKNPNGEMLEYWFEDSVPVDAIAIIIQRLQEDGWTFSFKDLEDGRMILIDIPAVDYLNIVCEPPAAVSSPL